MKKFTKFSVLPASGLAFLVSASPAFADTEVKICPEAYNQLCSLTFANSFPLILNILLAAAFMVALVFLIYGGIRWILSGGDKEGTSKAKGTVTAALIGLAIVLSSWLLINIIFNLFGFTQNGSTPFQIPDLIP